MDILNRIIQLMDKEELRGFKLYAGRTRPGEERKDIRLFDYIRKSGEKFNERKIQKELYGYKGKNSYYRLKNRLLTELGKSQTLQHITRDENMLLLHYLSLSILYRKKQQPEIAYFYLKKGESRALELGRLEVLDLIYAEYITLSYHIVSIDPEAYIHKRSENRITLNRLWEIDHILAAIHHRLRVSVNYADGDESVLDLLQKTVDEYARDPGLSQNVQFRFRLYSAVSTILVQKKDYVGLENYLIPTYEEFNQDGLFHKGNHDFRLQMLTYIINALIKNGKSELTLKYLKILEDAMEAFNRLYYDKYLFYYYYTLAGFYSSTDPKKAVETLLEMQENKKIASVPENQVYIHVNLALVYYAINEDRKSIQQLVKLSLQDSYAGFDDSMKFKITVFELALRYDLGEEEVLEYRVKQCRQDFESLFQGEHYRKEVEMINLLEAMNESRNVRKDTELIARIQAFLDQFDDEDTDFLKYSEFLAGKIAPPV